ASSRATTTRIGNSRQNDRFLRPRRVAGLRPPEAVLPSDTASAALSSSAAGPLASALLPVSALLLASALLPVSALLLASALLPVSALRLAWAVLLVSARAWSGTLASGVLASGVSAPLSALDARACSGSPGAALSSRPASGSAPGVTPRPAPL